MGTSRAHITLTATVTFGTPRLGCELTIDDEQSGRIFEVLQADREAIESELGELEWRPTTSGASDSALN